MTDVFSPEKRSSVMARIRSKDTKPELLIRKALHARGYRFRLHRKDLPGRPDIVLPRYRTVIFVHGCFWHAHANCHLAVMPHSNEAFWAKKLSANRQRDIRNVEDLETMGWRVLIIWECACQKSRLNGLMSLVEDFLHGSIADNRRDIGRDDVTVAGRHGPRCQQGEIAPS